MYVFNNLVMFGDLCIMFVNIMVFLFLGLNLVYEVQLVIEMLVWVLSFYCYYLFIGFSFLRKGFISFGGSSDYKVF